MAWVKSTHLQSALALVMALRLEIRRSYTSWVVMMHSGGSGSSQHLLTPQWAWSLLLQGAATSVGTQQKSQQGFLTAPCPRHECSAMVGMWDFVACVSKKKMFISYCGNVQRLCLTSPAHVTFYALLCQDSHKTLCSFLSREHCLKELVSGMHTQRCKFGGDICKKKETSERLVSIRYWLRNSNNS